MRVGVLVELIVLFDWWWWCVIVVLLGYELFFVIVGFGFGFV